MHSKDSKSAEVRYDSASFAFFMRREIVSKRVSHGYDFYLAINTVFDSNDKVQWVDSTYYAWSDRQLLTLPCRYADDKSRIRVFLDLAGGEHVLQAPDEQSMGKTSMSSRLNDSTYAVSTWTPGMDDSGSTTFIRKGVGPIETKSMSFRWVLISFSRP
jgi:hypothetical protein